jgi:hypothetical protein
MFLLYPLLPTSPICKFHQLLEDDLVPCVQYMDSTLLVSRTFQCLNDTFFIYKICCTIKPLLVLLGDCSSVIQLS